VSLLKVQKVVCQDTFLTRKPSPVKNRIEKLCYPDEDGEIIERTQGFSLARKYSSMQLREIDRRSTKQRKPTRRRPPTKIQENLSIKASACEIQSLSIENGNRKSKCLTHSLKEDIL
jgi:hypothetical protein